MSTSGSLSGFQRLPKLIVFDLDFTLWPLWCEHHVSPPFVRKKNVIYDSYKKILDVYADSEKILRVIKASTTVKLACASRTAAIRVAEQLLQILGWSDLFDYKVIYPGCKITHFKRFHELSGIEYADMVFFDDEKRNIKDICGLGVQCHLVERGITWNLFEQALKQFERKHKHPHTHARTHASTK
ncbi:unnamed protein product [Trichobilharzia szidati]|nr:unnamed protein product [Trichobilharzia szidati]